MGEPAETSVEISEFRGMATTLDASDLPPGVSAIQVNVDGRHRGKLEVRRGLREVVFEAEE